MRTQSSRRRWLKTSIRIVHDGEESHNFAEHNLPSYAIYAMLCFRQSLLNADCDGDHGPRGGSFAGAKPLCKFTRTRPALSSQAQRKPQIPLTHRQHVSVDTQRPQLWAFQAGLPEVSACCPTMDRFTLLTTPQIATTLRMAPSFATLMPAGRLPRLSRPRWVPLDAIRSSSTTSRR